MPVIKNIHPQKTLFFRLQKKFREYSPGKSLYTLAEAWTIIYSELKVLKTIYPWAVSLLYAPCDLKSHGSYGIIFTIRFIVDMQYKDTVIKFQTNDIYEHAAVVLSSNDFTTFDDWARAVLKQRDLRKYAKNILLKKALHYTF